MRHLFYYDLLLPVLERTIPAISKMMEMLGGVLVGKLLSVPFPWVRYCKGSWVVFVPSELWSFCECRKYGSKGLPGVKTLARQRAKQPSWMALANSPVRVRPTLLRNKGNNTVPNIPITEPVARRILISDSLSPCSLANPINKMTL